MPLKLFIQVELVECVDSSVEPGDNMFRQFCSVGIFSAVVSDSPRRWPTKSRQCLLVGIKVKLIHKTVLAV